MRSIDKIIDLIRPYGAYVSAEALKYEDEQEPYAIKFVLYHRGFIFSHYVTTEMLQSAPKAYWFGLRDEMANAFMLMSK